MDLEQFEKRFLTLEKEIRTLENKLMALVLVVCFMAVVLAGRGF